MNKSPSSLAHRAAVASAQLHHREQDDRLVDHQLCPWILGRSGPIVPLGSVHSQSNTTPQERDQHWQARVLHQGSALGLHIQVGHLRGQP